MGLNDFLYDTQRKTLSKAWKVDPSKISNKQIDDVNKKTKKDKMKSAVGIHAGTGSAATGVSILNKVRREGMVDGRVKRYHNTEKKNIDSILNEGLKKSHALDKDNLTSVTNLSDDIKKDKVYLSKTKIGAMDVGHTRNLYAGGTKPGKTMKINIPVDEYKKMNKVKNPELRGAKSSKEVYEKMKNGDFGFKMQMQANPLTAHNLKKTLGDNTDVLTNDIASKYIKGSKNYKKQTVKELASYIKHNPKNFAKGLGLGTAGLGLLGTGAYVGGKGLVKNIQSNDVKRYNPYSKNKEKTAKNIYKDSIEKVAREMR